MNHLATVQGFLPEPLTLAPDAVLTRMLDVLSLELECLDEDLDQLRQTHWINTAYRLSDAAKLGALLGVPPLPWENLRTYRARLLPFIQARLAGALGPNEVRSFVYGYLLAAEKALSDAPSRTVYQLLPGLQTVTLDEAYAPPAKRPSFRPLALVENPLRSKKSDVLRARGGNVPYLFRWTDQNRGLSETPVSFAVTGKFGNATSVPVLINLTTGDLIGYARPVPFGSRVEITARADTDRQAIATSDGHDVSEHLFSVSGFQLGTPFTSEDFTPTPRVPLLARGANDWIFLSLALFDVRGLNHFFLALAGQALREAAFDETEFDAALFPSGDIARLELWWTETEPASFEVQVPRYLVIEPSSNAATASATYQSIGDALGSALAELKAASVRSTLSFVPFVETQKQAVRVTLPWVVTPRQVGSAGLGDRLALGAKFGDTPLGDSRFE